jgi:hypothetical protein
MNISIHPHSFEDVKDFGTTSTIEDTLAEAPGC